jgi:threonine-phosphate decarboxylase
MSEHGGNIYAASQRTGIPERRIVDFSASINPLGVPEGAVRLMRRRIKDLPHYPEPLSEGLSARIAACLGVGEASVVCGNGSTELIYLIPRALKPEKVLIPSPTFGDYERACRHSGAAEVVFYSLRPENSFDLSPEGFIEAMSATAPPAEATGSPAVRAPKPCSLAFLCNPNNPTGRLVRKRDLLKIAEAAVDLSCHLVVDEAFIDFCPAESVAGEVPSHPSLIVLRSMTKFYALSGLRIGYGLFHPSVAGRIRAYKEPWTVNSLAQAAGLAVLEDGPYQEASREAMEREKVFMEEGLRKIGIPFIPSRANYYLLKVKDGPQVAALLEKKGILVRDCSSFGGLDRTYVRVAVRGRADNQRLLKEMAVICTPSS